HVAGASVVGEIVEQTRGPKVIAFKKRRRKNSRRKRGHRQDLTVVKITQILTGGAKAEPVKAAAAPPTPEAEPETAAAAPAKGKAKAAEAVAQGADTAPAEPAAKPKAKAPKR